MTPKLTKAAVAGAITPENRCAVKAFLHGIDQDSRSALLDALTTDPARLSALAVRGLLLEAGWTAAEVPSVNQIKYHRGRQRSCKCPI